eukprot:1160086-Pelagomonas_calceolata.AAC.5
MQANPVTFSAFPLFAALREGHPPRWAPTDHGIGSAVRDGHQASGHLFDWRPPASATFKGRTNHSLPGLFWLWNLKAAVDTHDYHDQHQQRQTRVKDGCIHASLHRLSMLQSNPKQAHNYSQHCAYSSSLTGHIPVCKHSNKAHDVSNLQYPSKLVIERKH